MQKRNLVNITRKATRKWRPHPPLSHCLLQLKYTVQQIRAHLKKSTLSGDIRDDPKHPGRVLEATRRRFRDLRSNSMVGWAPLAISNLSRLARDILAIPGEFKFYYLP